MNIFNLFGSKNSDDDDDQSYSSPNYSFTSYRDDPDYQKLLGITKQEREIEAEAEAEAEANEAKKWWQL